MYKYGSTLGVARYPLFKNKRSGTLSMLPRPVVKCRPGNIGHIIMSNSQWFQQLVHDIEFIALKHFEVDHSKHASSVKKHLYRVKKFIPPCLRVCDSIFTQAILIGNIGSWLAALLQYRYVMGIYS